MCNALLARMSRRAGRAVQTEVTGLFGPYPNKPGGAQRRMDFVETLAAGVVGLVDFTCPDGALPNHVGRATALLNPTHHLEDAEKKKGKKYADHPEGMKYRTFAMGTQGELGKEAMAWLDEWALDMLKMEYGPAAVPPAHKVNLVKWQALQELGVTLMKAQATQVFAHAQRAWRQRTTRTDPRPPARAVRGGRRGGRGRGGR